MEEPPKKEVVDDPFDDSFNFDNSALDPAVPAHSSVIEEPKRPLCHGYNRHVVVSVNTDKVYETVLDLKTESGKKTKTCVLKGSWINTRVKVGDVINLLLPPASGNNLAAAALCDGDIVTVDDKSDILVVVNPDVLVSGTSIMSSMFCMRKAVLSEYYKSFDGKEVLLIMTFLFRLATIRKRVIFIFNY